MPTLKLKSLFLLFLAMISFAHVSKGTHLMGGEITWRCLGGGNYVFQMKIYRDCLTPVPVVPPGGTIGINVHNHPTVTYIGMNQVSFQDISPQCNGAGPSYNCANPQAGNTAIEEYIYESNPIFLSGTPPAQGWVFTYTSCCRNAAITNLALTFNGPGNPSNGFTLRAIMYPLNGLNTNPCFDSSPKFEERPAIVICTGSPFVYNPNAFDADLDSLIYSFASPLDYLQGAFTAGNPPAIPWEIGYSLASPFPSVTQNPNNQAITLNQFTGEMAFTSYSQGAFVVVVKVSSYRCGELIAEIFREIQVVILSCPANFSPVVTPPFQNSITGLFTDYVDTVTAGDVVTFTISGADAGFLPTGFPQSVVLGAEGGQFGANYTDPNNGCAFPPCATLNPAPPVTSQGSVNTTFNWQTGCEHIAYPEGCYVERNTHTFTFLFRDDACPAPNYSVVTATIVIEALDVIGPPDLRCVDVSANGSTQLTWLTPPDPEGTFNAFLVYTAPALNGPYTLLDSIFNYNQTSYIHMNAGANNGPIYYYMRSRSGCLGRVKSETTDTLASIYTSISAITGTYYDVTWTPLSTPPPPTAAVNYDVLKGPIPWNMVDQQPGFLYPDSITNCVDSAIFRIELPDASGCISGSNVARRTFNFNTPPPLAELDSISLASGGPTVYVGWTNTLPNNNLYQYVILEYNNGSYNPVDTVPVTTTLVNIIDPNSTIHPVAYAIAVLDSCGNISLPGTPHQSIFLTSEVSSCTNEARMNWFPYIGFGATLTGYQVWVSRNGSPFTLAANVNAVDTNYVYDQLSSGDNYCFYVRAVSSTGASSSSNYICFAANTINLSDFTYLNYVTVEDDFTIALRGYYDNTSDVSSFWIVRLNMINGERDSLGPFILDPLTPFIDYIDEFITAQEAYYRYEIILIDDCGNFSDPSNIGQSILLEARTVPGFYNRLKWTPYLQWPMDVEKYRIYHCSDKYGTNKYMIGEVDGDQLNFEEDVIDSLPPNGQFCYLVEAVENDGNQYGFKELSKSNIVCVEHFPLIFIPNAWNRKGGLTYEFKPRGIYEPLAVSYRFSIYNRWGEKIFETLEPSKAWDGKYMGSAVKSDVYVYEVFLTTGAGDDYHRVGTVTLVD
jgi:hypothetical protein